MADDGMKSIEVEIRSFLTDDEYERLSALFDKRCGSSPEDVQVTYYFDTPTDVRIQRNSNGCKIWMKHGQLHDDAREEVEIHCAHEDFEKLKQLFSALGHAVKVVWLRKRRTYRWDDMTVCIDDTEGYGKIIELEQMATDGDQARVLQGLRERLLELGISETPKEEFRRRYMEYLGRWRTIIDEK
jgi:predicted adenylyl cyclase CyaB